MKYYLALLTASALALTACGGGSESATSTSNQEAPASNTATASASDTASVVASASQASSMAAECRITLDSNDNMQFSSKEIAIKSNCKDVTITLTHSGKMPKAGMGHNVVITKARDKDGVVSDGMSFGVDKDYLKPDDTRVVAATKLIGGGESDTITFPVSKLNKEEEYVFFCSFPGHVAMMSGKVVFVE